MRFNLLLLALVAGQFLSCSDDSEGTRLKTDAVLIWSGDYEVGGCGFTIAISNERYKAVNEDFIGDEYKTEPGYNDITLEYELLGEKLETYCGDTPIPNFHEGIRIISITRKDQVNY